MHHALHELIALLALRLASLPTPTALSAFLLDPGHRLDQAPWAINANHLHMARRQATALQALDIKVLWAPAIPARLREAAPCPPALFVRGDPSLLDKPAVAIVGSRRACADAERWTAQVARDHSQQGQLVVSGGARGIDAAAHAGALAAGGPTLAYLGSAVDRIYPLENKLLFQRIVSRGGAIVSEHPPMSSGAPWHHAARNRFIAAHAHTLVVAEAAERSGTLGTAHWAHRLNRKILVSPLGVARQRAGIDALLASGVAAATE